ncbi:MAG: lipid A export permease/ATP-binding protein MsbA [Gammaproteobacteria bacterium]|nr:lipid A export permease/ATP-binding protein MsbA [Gammaproteobacteria bacterium]
MATNDWSTYKRLLRYVVPYWYLFLVSILGFLAAAGAEAYFGYAFGQLIDHWEDSAVRASAVIPIMMFAAALVRGVGSVLGEILISSVSFNVVHNIREQLFGQLLRLPNSFFDKTAHGHLVSRITFTVAQLRDTGTDALRAIIQDGFKVIVFLGAMIWLDWKLTLIFIGTVPVLAIVVVFASSRFRRISQRIQNSMGDVTHVVSESVSGYRVVKTFGGEKYETGRFSRFNRINRQQNLKMVVTKVMSAQLNETLIALALCLLIFLLYDTAQTMTSGQAVAFLSWAGMLGRPIRRLSEVNAKLQRGLAAADDVFAQLDESIEVDNGTKELLVEGGELVFDNVSFSYASGSYTSGADQTSDKSKQVLKNITLRIAAGKTIAVVGRSGSGKTTLASLIPRFYDIAQGKILIDGTDTREFTLGSLRHQIALVSQQVTLFNDTLRNNIAYGDLADASDEAIEQAIERAHASEFINALPDGLETIVGDDGVLLSGGQRQRVAIARALLKNAPILILDEATSALDNESERNIQAALEEVMRDRTTLVIAHRLSTVEAADQIIVLKDGEVVEQGKHGELIETGGHYAELYNAQFQDSPNTTANLAPVKTKRARPRVFPSSESFEKSALGLTRAWYQSSWWLHLLRPFSWIYNWGRKRQESPYLTGKKTPSRTSLPVIVVGNITVGGTGKTPLVGWLVNELRDLGFSPGVVLRGYGGTLSKTGTLVPSGADPERYSDEGVQLRDRLGCSVVICANRVKALKILETQACDIAISDDGLQHYAMARDIEIAVVDGSRGVGNGLLIPAGPLREPLERLNRVDWVVANGEASNLCDNESIMTMLADGFYNLQTGEYRDCEQFAQDYVEVHAVCGIGNPSRFFATLQRLDINTIKHVYKDHHDFTGDEVLFSDGVCVVCTEKDAAKLKHIEQDYSNVWFMRISVSLSKDGRRRLEELLAATAITPQRAMLER